GPPFNWFHVPSEWLLNSNPNKPPGEYASRLIGAMMLIGSVVAMLSTQGTAKLAAKAFFEGAGYALTNIVSIIVTANCFGTGIKNLKLADWVGVWTKDDARWVWPLAGIGALLFAVISGSGMASTESLYRFFVQPNAGEEYNLRIGAVVSIAAAAGRTTS